MLKVLVLLMFLSPAFYNIIQRRKNTVRVKKRPILAFALVIFTIVSCIFWYSLDKSPIGFAIHLGAILLVYTMAFLPGLGYGGILVFMGTSPLLKFVSIDQVKAVSLGANSNDLELYIKAYGDEYKQVYDSKDREQIMKILDRNKLLKGEIYA